MDTLKNKNELIKINKVMVIVIWATSVFETLFAFTIAEKGSPVTTIILPILYSLSILITVLHIKKIGINYI